MPDASFLLNMNTFITGGAGTGKSYLSRELADKDSNIYVTSSTGISALQIGGVTLHRLLGLGLCQGTPEALARRMLKNKRLYSTWKNMKTLIIDEISMLDVGLFVRVSNIMKIVRENNSPWGGIQLILVGDFLQLPPVETYHEEDINGNIRAYKYLFQHPIWNELNLRIINLTEPRRTDDNDYYLFLCDIRNGILSDRVKDFIKARSIKPRIRDGIIPTILISTNREVDEFNMKKLERLPPISDTIDSHSYRGEFHTTMTGVDSSRIKSDIARQCLAPNPLYLRVGAQVMLLINMADLGLCNGSRGVVIGFDEKKLPIVKFLDGQVLTITPHTWTSDIKTDKKVYRSTWKHLPIKLAWAVTIHKSQGLTLDSVIVNLTNCFSSGMIYVALSRCRNPNDMFISGWRDDEFIRCRPDTSVLNFYSSLS